MTIEVTCKCGATYFLKPEFAGKQVKCATCRSTFRVPLPPVATDESGGLGSGNAATANLRASPDLPSRQTAGQAAARPNSAPAGSGGSRKSWRPSKFGLALIGTVLCAASIPLTPALIFIGKTAYDYFHAKALLADCTIVDARVQLKKMTRSQSTSSNEDGRTETLHSVSYLCEYSYTANGQVFSKQFSTSDFNRGDPAPIKIAYSNMHPANSGMLSDLETSANFSLNLIMSFCACLGALVFAVPLGAIAALVLFRYGKARRFAR